MYDRLSDSGLSKHSVLQVHRTLHRSLQHAFNWGLIPRNPATATMPPRPEKRQTTALELAELQGLFAAARGHRMFPFWVLMGTTGLRFGEALGLRWRDVHLEERRASWSASSWDGGRVEGSCLGRSRPRGVGARSC